MRIALVDGVRPTSISYIPEGRSVFGDLMAIVFELDSSKKGLSGLQEHPSNADCLVVMD